MDLSTRGPTKYANIDKVNCIFRYNALHPDDSHQHFGFTQVKILVDLWKMHEIIYCLELQNERKNVGNIGTLIPICEYDSPSERTIECQKYNNNGLVLMMSSYRGRKWLMAICWAHCSRLRLQRLLWCSPVVGDKVFLLSTLINLIRLNWASKQNSAAFPLKTFAFWMAQWTQSGLTSGRTMNNRKCENVEVEATTTALIQH